MNLSKLATVVLCLTLSAPVFATSGIKVPPVTTVPDEGTNSSSETTEPSQSRDASFWEQFYKALLGL